MLLIGPYPRFLKEHALGTPFQHKSPTEEDTPFSLPDPLPALLLSHFHKRCSHFFPSSHLISILLEFQDPPGRSLDLACLLTSSPGSPAGLADLCFWLNLFKQYCNKRTKNKNTFTLITQSSILPSQLVQCPILSRRWPCVTALSF